MALFTLPLMAAVQELCGRIALETGVGLGTSLRRKFPAWIVAVCILALLVANTINLGADLGAIAAGGSLLSRGVLQPLWIVPPTALLVVGLQFFVSYQLIFKVFKWLTLVLFAYVITGFLSHPNALEVLRATFIPHVELSRDFITAMVAVLGTTISPYLFFWQASSEVDQMKAAGLQVGEPHPPPPRLGCLAACGGQRCGRLHAQGRASGGARRPLTPRERDVLALSVRGASAEEVARTLQLTRGTVRNYLSIAIQKLGATNRVEAARIADEKGWL